MQEHDPPLRAVAITCSLAPSPNESSSDLLARQILGELEALDSTTERIRAADHAIHHGVKIDMGNGDDWPDIREKILKSDILVLATPIWMGHPSSMVQKVLERLDAELSESDEEGRLLTYGKVAIVAVVGNEDGAHKVTADLFQALNDVGFSVPAAASVYWVGEAMQTTDYKDLAHTPDKVATSMKVAAANATHLARLLKKQEYPPAS